MARMRSRSTSRPTLLSSPRIAPSREPSREPGSQSNRIDSRIRTVDDEKAWAEARSLAAVRSGYLRHRWGITPAWLKRQETSGHVLRPPDRAEMEPNINEDQIVAYYSR